MTTWPHEENGLFTATFFRLEGWGEGEQALGQYELVLPTAWVKKEILTFLGNCSIHLPQPLATLVRTVG